MSTAATTVRPVLVYRQVSFTLAAFDHLKDWQRHIERTEGRRVTNSEVLNRVILASQSPCP